MRDKLLRFINGFLNGLMSQLTLIDHVFGGYTLARNQNVIITIDDGVGIYRARYIRFMGNDLMFLHERFTDEISCEEFLHYEYSTDGMYEVLGIKYYMFNGYYAKCYKERK